MITELVTVTELVPADGKFEKIPREKYFRGIFYFSIVAVLYGLLYKVSSRFNIFMTFSLFIE